MQEDRVLLTKADLADIQAHTTQPVVGVSAVSTDAFRDSIPIDHDILLEVANNKKNTKHFSTSADVATADRAALDRLGFTVTGRLPETSDEVAINNCAFHVFQLFGYQDIAQNDDTIYPIDTENDLIGKTISLSTDGLLDGHTPNDEPFEKGYKTIVGVVDTGCDRACASAHPKLSNDAEEYYHEKFFVAEDAIDHFSYLLCPTEPQKKDMRSFVDFIFDTQTDGASDCVYSFVNSFSDDFFDLSNTVTVAKYLCLWLSLIFFLFAFCLLVSFIASSMRSQFKQIGVLLSLGANFGGLFAVYASAAFALGAGVFLLSYPLSFLLNGMMNKYFAKVLQTTFKVFRFHLTVPLVLFVAIALTVLIGCVIPLIKARKKSPTDVLKEGAIK
jgi:hypothetical protein